MFIAGQEYLVEELYKAGIIKRTRRGEEVYVRTELIPAYTSIMDLVINQWIQKLSSLQWDFIVTFKDNGVLYASIISYLLKKPYTVIDFKERKLRIVKGVLLRKRALILTETEIHSRIIEALIKKLLDSGAMVVGYTVLIDYELGGRNTARTLRIPYIPLIKVSRISKLLGKEKPGEDS